MTARPPRLAVGDSRGRAPLAGAAGAMAAPALLRVALRRRASEAFITCSVLWGKGGRGAQES